MNTQEDFDFYSPLPVSEALNRLNKYSDPSGHGSFYGTVEGNYFNLQHAVGSINDGNDDPPVTGYILPKGAGCWVSARTQAPEVQEYNATVAKFFTMALMLICVFVTYGWWENRGKDFPNHATDMQALTKLAFWLLLDLGAAVAGWRYLKKFKQVGKFDTMSQFRKLLEAETLPLENTQK